MELPDLTEVLLERLDEMQIPYCLVGSVASGALGEPRMTRDIDVVVSLMPEDSLAMTRAFPSPEYYVSPEAIGEAIRTGGQFNVIHSESGIKIDFMIARKDAWGRMQLVRRRRVNIFPDLEGYVAAPEDIILSKMLYYRQGGSEKHLRDITGILKVSGPDVDHDYVNQWAETLEVTDIWQAILQRLAQ